MVGGRKGHRSGGKYSLMSDFFLIKNQHKKVTRIADFINKVVAKRR